MRLHDAREFDDGFLVVEVLAPGDLGHGEMVIDEEDEIGEISTLQAHPARHSHSRQALAALASAWRVPLSDLAGIVQEHGEVKDIVGPRRLLQAMGRYLEKARLLRVDDLVENFDADEGVFVGGVAVKEFVLDEAGKRTEFREKRPRKPSSCMVRKRARRPCPLREKMASSVFPAPPSGR